MFRKSFCSTGLLVGLLAGLMLVTCVHGLKKYVCNSADKIEDIRQLNTSLRRLVEHNDRLYFIFRDRIISTDLLVTEEQTQFKFLSLDFKEQENTEEDVPSEIADNYLVYGYYHDLDNQMTGELYRSKKAETQDTKIYGKYSSISSENGELKRKPLNMDWPIEDTDNSHYSHQNATFFNSIRKTIKTAEREELFQLVVIHFTIDASNDTQYGFDFRFVSDQRPTKPLKHQKGYTHFAFNLVNVTHYDESDGPFDGLPGTSHGRFIGVYKERAALQLDIYFMAQRLLTPTKSSQHTADAVELFNCFVPMTSLSTELKGIWYVASKKLWYILIRRFYLKLPHSALKNEFALTPDEYMSKGRELKLYRTTKFFELNQLLSTSSKEVKNIGSKAYYSRESYKFHEMSLDAKDELVLTELPEEPIITLNECPGSTLKIGEHLYCFKETFYNHMVNLTSGEMNFKSHPINSIFATLVDWTDQVVHLVFNYDDQHFVIMTKTDLFVFEYSRFTAKGMEGDFRLMHSYDSFDQVTRIRNCLIAEECLKDDPRNPRTPEEKSWMRNLTTRILMVVLVVVIVAVVALLVWTFRRGLHGEGSEHAQYFVHMVKRMGSQLKSFSKLSIVSKTGSTSDIPPEHRSPKKDEVMAKALKGLKNVKDLRVIKSGKGVKSPSESSLPGYKKGKGVKKAKSLTGQKAAKSKIKGSQLGDNTKSKSKGSQSGDRSRESLLGETMTKGSAISEKTKSKGSLLGDSKTKIRGSQVEETKSKGSQLDKKKSKSGSKQSGSKSGSITDLKASSKQPASKAGSKADSKTGSKSGSKTDLKRKSQPSSKSSRK